MHAAFIFVRPLTCIEIQETYYKLGLVSGDNFHMGCKLVDFI